MLKFQLVDRPDHAFIPVIRELFEEYWAELAVDTCFQGFSEELKTLPGKYSPPRGVLFAVFDGEFPVACGALRELDRDTCELKRIYVRPVHRGFGLGRRITIELLDQARQMGYRVARLDTLRILSAARSLYESLGFYEIEPYNDAGGNDVVYFERTL